MIVTTLNSVYHVRADGNGKWLVTKLRALQHSEYITLGETRISWRAEIQVGKPAIFDTWRTSTTVSVED